MSEIRIHIDGDFDPRPRETYIGLINIDRPPFHLITISDQKQFSWEIGRSRIGEPVDSLLRHLRKNQVRCIFLKVSEDSSLFDLVENSYRNSENVKTCIGPINSFLDTLNGRMDLKPLTIFELMDFLKANTLWTRTYGFNLNQEEIELEIYDRQVVDQHVEGLKTLEPQRS